MKILITGGVGFIGTNAALHFHSQGHQVTCLDNFSRPNIEANAAVLHSANIQIIKADVQAIDTYLDVLKTADFILHLAGQTAVTTSVKNPLKDFADNLHATLILLEAVRLHRPQAFLIYSSTNKVYGDLNHHSFNETKEKYLDLTKPDGIDESEPLQFISPYGCSKGAADQYVLDYNRIYGLQTTVFRQSCIYGPHQQGVEDQGWVAHFSKQLIQDKPITIFGNGKQVRDLLYVTDLIQAYELAFTHKSEVSGQVFNIGGGPENAFSLLEVLTILSQKLEVEPKLSFEPIRLGDQVSFISANLQARSELSWQPQTPFETGIDHLLSWQKDFLS